MDEPAIRHNFHRRLGFAATCVIGLAVLITLVVGAYLLGRTDRIEAITQIPPKGFMDSVSTPIWIILILNLASLVSSAVASYAAFKITPTTALKIANVQADVSRSAVEMASKSADAALHSAEAAHKNAAAATRSSVNAGVHAVARLRQEWINELRSRVAQAHSLLSNWRQLPKEANTAEQQEFVRRTIEANEVMARIELLLNLREPPSQSLLAALQALHQAGGSTDEQRRLGAPVIAAAQKVLKEEWDRVRTELRGETVS